MLVAQFNPDIEIIVKPTQRYVKVQGVVSVPSATIRPPAAGADIVGESADVSVIDRRLTGNVAKILAVSAPWSINADIGLDLGDDVSFGRLVTQPLSTTVLSIIQPSWWVRSPHGCAKCKLALFIPTLR